MNVAAASFDTGRAHPLPGSLAVRHDYRASIEPALPASQRLGTAWDDLAGHAAEPNVFAERWFARASLRHLGSADLRMLEVWTTSGPNELVGMVPLCIAPAYGRVPARHVQNWLHFHAFLGTPLVRKGHEQGFWSAALSALDDDPWASGFLHLEGLTEDGPVHRGLLAAAAALGRPCDTVLRTERALLASSLSPQAYYEQTVRKKKRKELKRLSARLAELGRVEHRRLQSGAELESWCDAFLELERAGWKGERGSALACSAATEAFFREAVSGAWAAGRLDLLRLDLDGSPLAMLVNFLAPPGSFSFKIAYDEAHARFSPGVLIQLENLNVLARADIGWMDSCAVEDHPMINSLWGERRQVVRVTVPLKGFGRKAVFHLCRTAENLSAALRRRRGRVAEQGKADEDE